MGGPEVERWGGGGRLAAFICDNLGDQLECELEMACSVYLIL